MTRTILFLIVAVLYGCGQTQKKSKEEGKKAKLEKIIFHTSGCCGTCPTYHLQIDNNKNIKLYKEQDYSDSSSEPDTTKAGYFIGAVADSTFFKLTDELETIGIDTITFEGPTCCGFSVKTIIIYYNGERKFLKSMHPPAIAGKLIGILHDVCNTNNLKRTKEKFKIEDGEAGR